MREKLQTLPLKELREIAKANGIKSVTIMRKADVIDAILAANEMNKASEEKYNKKTEATKKADKKMKENKAGDEAAEKKENSANKKKVAGKREEAINRKKTVEKKEASAKNKERMEKNQSPNNKEEVNEDLDVSAEFSDKGESSDYKEEIDEKDINYNEGDLKTGILEIMSDGFGFIRCDNYMPGDDDVYVAPTQIRKFGLKTGDVLTGRARAKKESDKFAALYYLDRVNGDTLDKVLNRKSFEDLTPIFPNERLHLETDNRNMAMRIVDLVSPIGKGQRGMIVSPPKAGKTTLLKETAKSVLKNNPEMHMIILLIDERPEEVTDIKEAIQGDNVEVIYSTFDELPEHHKRVSEMVIERAKRLVEHGKDVIILLDSITRLARAYNLLVPPSGRTLSGGLDPAALYMPKRFFGSARNMREGGSLTILATALVDTGSKMDDVVYEEFKGTGNMELVLDRKLSEKRVFPAIDIVKSGTRREDLLLNPEEKNASYVMRKEINGMRADDAVEKILDLFYRTRSNNDFVKQISRITRRTSPMK